MKLPQISGAILAIVSLLISSCSDAEAHSFGVMYTLPIPFWMYAFAASATLVLSFLMIGFFFTGKPAERSLRAPKIEFVVPPACLSILRCLSVFLLALTVLTGLFGTPNPLANFSLTFFWIGFVLGGAYLSALIGGIYEFVNPWRVLCDLMARIHLMGFKGQVRYPAWLAYYPALALYMYFIWLELFGHTTPTTLSLNLLGYTGLNIGAAALFGTEAWFRYGEFFAVFFRLLGKIAPVVYLTGPETDSKVIARLRLPCIALIEETAEHPSILLFVLFMLSSTAFDGVHETLPWVQMYWKYLYPAVTWAIQQPYSFFVYVYYGWQWAMLLLSPFAYLAIYLAFVGMMTGSKQSLRVRALMFCYSLLPIAFVYNVSHYFTLLITDGPRLLPLMSDPFGFGEDIFGTAHFFKDPIIPPSNFVWHAQVGLILLGHLLSVYLAHAQALRIFSTSKEAFWSQVPMLFLMIAFTTIGLWILSLPIGAGQVIDPSPGSLGVILDFHCVLGICLG